MCVYMLPWRRRRGWQPRCYALLYFFCFVYLCGLQYSISCHLNQGRTTVCSIVTIQKCFTGVYTLRNFFLKIFWSEEHCVSGSSGARFSLLPWR